MNDDASGESTPDPDAEAATWAAKAADIRGAGKAVAADMAHDPELQQEWSRQNNQIYGALIAIGLIWVQPFLTIGVPSTAARVCVIAFSVAIPLLAGLMLLNRHESFRGRVARSCMVTTTRAVAQLAAFIGVVAGFWHIYWVAGVVVLAAGILAMSAHSAGYVSLEKHTTLKKVMTYTPKSKDAQS